MWLEGTKHDKLAGVMIYIDGLDCAKIIDIYFTRKRLKIHVLSE